jgi:VWFA-related protein
MRHSILGKSSLRGLLVSLLMGSACLIAQGQSQPAAPATSDIKIEKASDTPAPVVLRATTRLVMVDVLATDSKGNPITDLKPEDFTVVEDGKEQKVRTLAFQKPIREAITAAPALPPNVVTNKAAYRGTNTLNVILLDALNTNTLNQTLARQKILEFLAKMPTDQPIAVYTMGAKLRMLQDFTTDPAILQRAIKDIALESNALNHKQAALDEDLPAGYFDSIQEPQLKEDLLRFEAEKVSVQTDLRVAYCTDSLQALARRLAGFPGRKNLIWISEGFPLVVNPETQLGTSAFSATRNYSEAVAKTVNALLDAQVAIYPVDARGLSAGGLSEANSNGSDQLGRQNTSGVNRVLALREQAEVQVTPQQIMNDLAGRTGGKALYNRNDLDTAIESSITDGSTYYLVGYYPDDKNWNGRFRKIQVKLNRPGAKLRYRLGYYAVDPDVFLKVDPKQRGAEFVRALNPDLPISTALKFEAGLTPPSAATTNKLTIKYTIDGRALAFDSDNKDGMSHAEVQCAVRVYSDKGKFVKADVDTMSAAVKPNAVEGLRQQGFPCEQGIELPKGSYFLRLGVRDTRSGLLGTANARIVIP